MAFEKYSTRKNKLNSTEIRAYSLMDRVVVCGTTDPSSILGRRTLRQAQGKLLEECQSGLLGSSRKACRSQGLREFESHLLR